MTQNIIKTLSISTRPFCSIWRSIPRLRATSSASYSTRSRASSTRSSIRLLRCAECMPFPWSFSSTATAPFTWRSTGRASGCSRMWLQSDSGAPTTTSWAGPRSAPSRWRSLLWSCSLSAGLRTTPSAFGTGWTSPRWRRSTRWCGRLCWSLHPQIPVWIPWSTGSTTYAAEWTITIR